VSIVPLPEPRPISISAPLLGDEVEQLVVMVLRSGHLAQGPMVERFEELCAAMAGTAHAVALGNGSVALDAALELCGVRPGDEVITSPFTFAATLNAILRRRAVARFADIGEDFNVDPDSVTALMNPRTRAVMPVHLFGLMADMDAIAVAAARYGVAIIEDAAQAHGATQRGRPAGSFGFGCFSFYATKNVTAGEGGCLTTDDTAAADRLRVLRNQGMRDRYEYVQIGANWRMTDIAAAIAIPQLLRLRERTRQRRINAARLTELLAADPRIETPILAPWRTHVWHQYTVLLPRDCSRPDVMRAMARDGIQTGVYYPKLVWDHAPYRSHPGVIKAETPRALDAATRCLSIPVHPGLQPGDVERIASSLLMAVADAAPVITRQR
jgi:dTDP-4-amino-4,6-dideoxygalactose transaminase